MSPSEFLRAHGPAVPRYYTIAAGAELTIPADENRYILTFWTTTGDTLIRPGLGDITTVIGYSFLAGNDPLVLTHSEHGALVNLRWIVRANAGAVELITVEAFMYPRRRSQVYSNGKAKIR